MHEDDLFSTRVSFFLLAQSILIAITAAVINAFAGLRSTADLARTELFGLAIALDLFGVVLTAISWWIFTMNENGLAILTNQLKALDPMYTYLDRLRQEERSTHWYYRTILRRKAPNRAIKMLVLPLILLVWLTVAAFAIAIYFTR